MNVDCYDFYLWSIGKLRLIKEEELPDLVSPQEEL